MQLYDVTVRNELTGDVATLSVSSQCPQDAQVEALVQAFRCRGWRSATALPVDAGPSIVGHMRRGAPEPALTDEFVEVGVARLWADARKTAQEPV